MERLIYSKFSNERDSRYAIETSIIEDENAKKWVLKRPMFKEGTPHFDNMKRAYGGLKNMFENSVLEIQPYIEQDEGMRFPFIEGDNMENLLHVIYGDKGYVEVVQQIKEYFDMIKEYSSTETFVKTSDFVKMFGEFDFPQDTKCGKFNNLDYGFANVIISEEGKTLIDYEWTVDFPIPLDFLLYRALHYYVYTCPESVDLIQHGIFKDLGFEDDDIKKYIEMEQNFQKYISAGKVSLGELHDTMGQKTYNVHEIYSEFRKHETPGMQVYYDYGEGFLHENSYFIKPEIDEEGNETICIKDIPENALRVRIDPRKHKTVLVINKLASENENNLLPEMETNGVRIKDSDVYVFDVIDPWVVVRNNKNKEIIFCACEKADGVVMELSKLTKVNEMLIRDNDDLKNKVEFAEKQYNEVIHSTSWRITEPLRKIGVKHRK